MLILKKKRRNNFNLKRFTLLTTTKLSNAEKKKTWALDENFGLKKEYMYGKFSFDVTWIYVQVVFRYTRTNKHILPFQTHTVNTLNYVVFFHIFLSAFLPFFPSFSFSNSTSAILCIQTYKFLRHNHTKQYAFLVYKR